MIVGGYFNHRLLFADNKATVFQHQIAQCETRVSNTAADIEKYPYLRNYLNRRPAVQHLSTCLELFPGVWLMTLPETY